MFRKVAMIISNFNSFRNGSVHFEISKYPLAVSLQLVISFLFQLWFVNRLECWICNFLSFKNIRGFPYKLIGDFPGFYAKPRLAFFNFTHVASWFDFVFPTHFLHDFIFSDHFHRLLLSLISHAHVLPFFILFGSNLPPQISNLILLSCSCLALFHLFALQLSSK